ncbi:hypothetical protein [Streptomyces lichenis]|uniref:Cation/H+ exchanger domain-containing protein n=1 Tax=Streptomyces lichenis TaxID=2306967 RepID=A0ABT0I3P2_9ACTN|nr:hypothetical protein [Streptomyces lichenis]MCK8675953.1 hypothetical protein [Streptomyces lichenis]
MPAFFGLLGLLRSGGALLPGGKPATAARLLAGVPMAAGLTVGIARLTTFLGCEPIARARPVTALGATVIVGVVVVTTAAGTLLPARTPLRWDRTAGRRARRRSAQALR